MPVLLLSGGQVFKFSFWDRVRESPFYVRSFKCLEEVRAGSHAVDTNHQCGWARCLTSPPFLSRRAVLAQDDASSRHHSGPHHHALRDQFQGVSREVRRHGGGQARARTPTNARAAALP